MRRVLMILLALLLLSGTVFASEEETDLTSGLNDEAMELLPESGEQAPDLLESIKEIFFGALQKAFGSIREGVKLCSVLLCILTLCSVLDLADIKRKEKEIANEKAVCNNGYVSTLSPALLMQR